jgi:hypothetical protein
VDNDDPIERRRKKRRADDRSKLAIVAVVAGALVLTLCLAGGIVAAVAWRSAPKDPGDGAGTLTAPVFGPPASVSDYIRKNFNDGAEVRHTEFLRVSGTMAPTLGDMLTEVASKEGIKHQDGSAVRPPDRRVAGVYYVEFARPAGFAGDFANYQKRWLFYVHPDGQVSIHMPVVSKDWRNDVRDWVDTGK